MTSNTRNQCAPILLAASELLRIEYCRSCQQVALQFGVITVRLHPRACQSVLTTLAHALNGLRRLEEEWSSQASGAPSQQKLMS
ncbi:MAG TPA: hypothetical protein VHC69_04100 [Polyangiaceae bacterium]|nr:hypothetical protein [Polyangiaceae bacterium]